MKLLKKTFSHFIQCNPLDLAASLSFYIIFSVGPLIYFVALLASMIYDNAIPVIIEDLLMQLDHLIGQSSTNQLRPILESLTQTSSNIFYKIVGFIILFFVATNIFNSLQKSLNQIWHITSTKQTGLQQFIKTKFFAFIILILIALSFSVWLISNAFVSSLEKYLLDIFPEIENVVSLFKSFTFEFLLTSIIFAFIFKLLPSAKIKWKELIVGASFTSLLFHLGKYLIAWYLKGGMLTNIYDALGSIMIFFIWFYFSSLLFYFGAAFTYVYAEEKGSGIKPL